MTEPGLFPYDAVLYPGHAFDQTHPDRMATIASLFGMRPAPPSRCRVLELGCGAGANLIPMAYQCPGSEFLGIDRSAPSVAGGRADIAALGLANIALRTCDITAVDANFGRFDYIIAHGVYSWVPPAVRAKILSIFRERLAPQGVAYLSFNAYPGSRLRDLGRRMMLFHVRGLAEPLAQARQGRALLRFLAEVSDPDEVYGAVLREVAARAQAKPDAVLFHDDLDAQATAFLLHDVVEAAERETVQYLSEATFAHSALGAPPEHARGLLDRIPADQLVLREQYLDFLVGRWFRETLFCHADVALRRTIDPQSVKKFSIAAAVRPRSADPRPHGEGAEEFASESGGTIAVRRPLTKAAFLHLGRIWPQAIRFPALVESASAILRDGGDGAFAAAPADVETLAGTLLRAYGTELLHLHVEPPRLATTLSERPAASRLARRQAEAGPLVTNLRHVNITLQDAITRRFLTLADGTRTVDELAAAVDRLLEARGQRLAKTARTAPPAASGLAPRARAENLLKGLARLALLEA